MGNTIGSPPPSPSDTPRVPLADGEWQRLQEENEGREGSLRKEASSFREQARTEDKKGWHDLARATRSIAARETGAADEIHSAIKYIKKGREEDRASLHDPRKADRLSAEAGRDLTTAEKHLDKAVSILRPGGQKTEVP
jgi:hypothetical protein